MTTNQVQTEQQRSAEVKRKAEKAQFFYRKKDDETYDVGNAGTNWFSAYNKRGDHFMFAYDHIAPEDKFLVFELTEIK